MECLQTYVSDSDSYDESENNIFEGTIEKSEETINKVAEGTIGRAEGTKDNVSEGTTENLCEGTIEKSVGIIDKFIKGIRDKNSPECKVPSNTQDREQKRHGEETFCLSAKSAPSFNFLGLETCKTKSDVCVASWPQVNGAESRKLQTTWGEVEIPNGDFWTDFQPDCTTISCRQDLDAPDERHKLQSYHTDSCQSFVTRTNSDCLWSQNSSLLQNTFKNSVQSQNSLQLQNSQQGHDSLQLQSSLKRLHQGNNNSVTAEFYENRLKQSRLSDPSIQISIIERSSSNFLPQSRERLPYSSQLGHKQQTELHNDSLTNKPTLNEKRKLFYIHSKVAPYVNTTPRNKCANRHVSSWRAHNTVVNRLDWNVPNFSHLLATAGMDAIVKVWNVWSSLDQCVASLTNHRKAVKHVEWCPAGRTVLSCSYDRTAQITDVETAQILGKYEHTGFVTAGHVHPSDPNLFVTGTDNLLVKWDMRTPQAPVKHFCYKDKFGQVQDLLFINNGQEFVACSDLVTRDCADRTVMVWDLRAGTVLSNQIFQERYVCTRLKLHPNGLTFMAQCHAGYIVSFSTKSTYKMDKSKRCEGHKIEGHNIGFDISPDGSLVYSGSSGNGMHCYHESSSKLLRKLPSKHDIVTDVACHPVLPSCLASCTWGGSVSLWM